MKFAKALIFISGVLFIGFGAGFVFAPHFFFNSFTGGLLTTTSSAIDMRATYGGLGLGVGIWFLLCAQQNLRLGLSGAIAVFSSIVFGRIVGFGLDGNANIVMYVFVVLEAVFLTAAFLVLQRIGK